MTDKAPERIWAWLDLSLAAEERGILEGEWADTQGKLLFADDWTYVREDIHEAVKEERDALREALEWAYTGDGLDECAMFIQSIITPFQDNTKPDHAIQVSIRSLVDAVRKRAALQEKP